MSTTSPQVSVLDEARHREAAGVFAAAYLVGPVTDRMWARSERGYTGSAVRGVVEDDGSVGAITRSFPQRLAVPGGDLAAAGVSSVGVRPDRRRRGYLRALMTDQLTALRADGVRAATLRATEAGIYSRFGYGVASSYAPVTIDRARARLRPDAAVADVTLAQLDAGDAVTTLPAVHERIRSGRPGTIDRPGWWWHSRVANSLDRDEPVWVLTAADPQTGDTVGWVGYTAPERHRWGHGAPATLQVGDLVAADARVELALWQAVLAIDLAEHVVAPQRPVDTLLPLALTDRRAARIGEAEDETWLRLLDVDAALQSRSYAGEGSVVLAVTDALLPANSGNYRIGAAGVARTDDAPVVTLDVAELASVYLGGTSVADLLAVGRVTATPAAAAAADALLATPQQPWAGTYF